MEQFITISDIKYTLEPFIFDLPLGAGGNERDKVLLKSRQFTKYHKSFFYLFLSYRYYYILFCIVCCFNKVFARKTKNIKFKISYSKIT